MYYTLAVQVFQSLDYLINIIGSFLFSKSVIWWVLKFFIYFSSMAILKNQINFLVIPKPSVNLTNIFMTQMRLDFNFIFDRMLWLIFDYLLFKKCFQYYNKFSFHLTSQIYLTKFTSTQWLPYFKIIYLPLLWIKTFNRQILLI